MYLLDARLLVSERALLIFPFFVGKKEPFFPNCLNVFSSSKLSWNLNRDQRKMTYKSNRRKDDLDGVRFVIWDFQPHFAREEEDGKDSITNRFCSTATKIKFELLAVWPDSVKFDHFDEIIIVFGKLIFGKILILF